MRNFIQDITDQRREQLVVHEVNKILKSDDLNDEVGERKVKSQWKILPYSSQLERDIADQVRKNLSNMTSRLEGGLRPSSLFGEGERDWNKKTMILFVPIDIKLEWAVEQERELK